MTRFNRCSPRLLRLALLSNLLLCVSCNSSNRWSGEDWSGKLVRLEITLPGDETDTHFINPDDPAKEISKTVAALLSRDFDKGSKNRARDSDELLRCRLSFPSLESGPEKMPSGDRVVQRTFGASMSDIHYRIVRRSEDRLGFGLDRRATADADWEDTEGRFVAGSASLFLADKIARHIEGFNVFAKASETMWDE